MNTLVGIKNCDSVRKARKWLEENGVAYSYHDLREDGLDKAALQAWIRELGWEVLLNKRSTTWKQLSAEDRSDLNDTKAMMLLLAHPTLIKRPLLISRQGIHVGFNEAKYRVLFPK